MVPTSQWDVMPEKQTASAPPLSLDFLHRQLGFNLRLAHKAASRDLDGVLTKLKLTQRQCIALQLIGANAGVSQIDIAETLGIDRSSMMAIADELGQQKLISRRKSKSDGRRQEIRLTPRGKSVLKRARDLMRTCDGTIAKQFSKRELEVLLADLRRIHRRF